MTHTLLMIWAWVFLMFTYAIPIAWLTFRLSLILNQRLRSVFSVDASAGIAALVIALFFVVPAWLFATWAAIHLLAYIGFPL